MPPNHFDLGRMAFNFGSFLKEAFSGPTSKQAPGGSPTSISTSASTASSSSSPSISETTTSQSAISKPQSSTPSIWEQLIPIFSSSGSKTQVKADGEASSFYENNNLPIDPIPVTAGRSVIMQQEGYLRVITSNHDLLFKKASYLDRQWPLITSRARQTNALIGSFEREAASIPALTAGLAALRAKMEAAFELVQTLEDVVTALEVEKASRDMAQWKLLKQAELTRHKLKATAEIEGLTARKTSLERLVVSRGSTDPAPAGILEGIAASMFYSPKAQP